MKFLFTETVLKGRGRECASQGPGIPLKIFPTFLKNEHVSNCVFKKITIVPESDIGKIDVLKNTIELREVKDHVCSSTTVKGWSRI